MPKEDKLYMGVYNDYYGGLLTRRQSEMLALYYDEDLSLAEIAEQYGVSRQAVRDCIVRAETQLSEYEQKLGIVKKIEGISRELKGLLDDAGLTGRARETVERIAGGLED